ncbi:MAG TPA: ABC transporter permease [Bryobacteraceae bacterium]|nr:ABC transporter permease [Bryobacteraceae bacterium]
MALTQEFRFAARMLAKNKGWTAMAVLALALGLGANVAIFSTVGLMLWPPVPYPEPDRLVFLPLTNPQRGISNGSASLPDLRDWASASAIASIGAVRMRPAALSAQGEAQYVPALQVTPEVLPLLRVSPARGRAFLPSETPETDSRVVLISHELWQGQFRGEAAVVGRDLRVNGAKYTVVGVLPEKFRFLYQPVEIVTPLALSRTQQDRDWRGLRPIARLRPGVTVAQAAAEIRAISERIERENARAGKGWRGDVRPLADMMIGKSARTAACTMFGAVAFVLLIACANIASLVLARGTQRRREMALRASLGASRGLLVRLQLIESVLLSVLGGAVGIVSAYWTIPVLKRVAPPEMGLFDVAALDWHALVFGLALSAATGLIFGIVPALLLTGGDLAPVLQEASRGSSGGRHVFLRSLVAVEMALSLVLAAVSTLQVRSILRQASGDAGFDRTNLAVGSVTLPRSRYPGDAQVRAFYVRALENLRRDAGVEAAALVNTLPLSGAVNHTAVRVEGQDPRDERFAGEMIVSPGYFQAMRIPRLAGRDFSEADGAESQPVAMVNETFVRRFWPKESSALGQRLQMGPGKTSITVVGVVRDVHHTNVGEPPHPEVYRPHAQPADPGMMLVARGRGGAGRAITAIRAAVAEVDREQPVFRLGSMEAYLYNRGSGERATAQVTGFLAVLALALAAVGTYGVMAYSVAQRLREIGIRMALGATAGNVFSMVLRGGVVPAAIGMLLGFPAAYGAVGLLRALDPGINPRDSASYAGVAAILFAVALAACAIPAWRATRVNAISVLRDE